jgi:hypothetical protein
MDAEGKRPGVFLSAFFTGCKADEEGGRVQGSGFRKYVRMGDRVFAIPLRPMIGVSGGSTVSFLNPEPRTLNA